MKLRADYHIHSTYSRRGHGKSTIQEIASIAAEKGLEEIAVTDHGPKHYMFGVLESRMGEAKGIIEDMRRQYPDLKILYGVEANILDYEGTTDINGEVLKQCDIILCGFHLGALFSTPRDFWNFIVKNRIGRKNRRVREEMTAKNTEAFLKAMDRYKIDILTHPGDKIPLDIDKIAAKAQEKGIILEINNSHGHLNSEEIKIAAKYDVKFAINSDAHVKERVGSFDEALKAAKAAGLDLKRIINLI
ncbi:MAG: PHP domain-containing protein [Sedimentibacter sp.]|uniref:PHP domain-containing protein n=1 Tax=Sedimentibacter sp. TaxID=1960295 RepID=UPI0031595F48